MRKTVVVVLLVLLLSIPLWGQSVTISQEKLNELIQILQQYNTITQQLKTSLDNSQASISALQLGFNQYKQEVDAVLIPKAKAQEGEIFWLKIGVGVSVGVTASVLVYESGHALHFW